MIYLVHHGQAAATEIDAQRPLTNIGRAHVDRLAAAAAARNVKPSSIWHSGKLRARQTAEAFLRLCNPMAEFAAIRGLQPSDPPDWIQDRVAGEVRDVMIVGLMPHLPRLLTRLVTQSDAPLLEFPPNGLVAIELVGEKYEERWRLV
jgi:phosphohistidine phosphatase